MTISSIILTLARPRNAQNTRKEHAGMPTRQRKRSVHSQLRDMRRELADVTAQLASANSDLNHYRRLLTATRSAMDAVHTRANDAKETTFHLSEVLAKATDQIRQLRAFATVTAVRAMLDVSPAEAVALLSEGAVDCRVDADDVVAAAQTILPDAYRLGAKACVEVATTPPSMTDIVDTLSELRSRYVSVGQ